MAKVVPVAAGLPKWQKYLLRMKYRQLEDDVSPLFDTEACSDTEMCFLLVWGDTNTFGVIRTGDLFMLLK